MRRLSILVLFLTVTGLPMVPGQASAQQDLDHPYRVEALILGTTDPDEDPHNLGVNRVARRSGFQLIEADATIDCEGEIALASLQLPPDHTIPYETDDDITDGFGELDPTDDSRILEDHAAVEFRVPPGVDDPAPAEVRVRILEGRYHRLLNVLEVDLRLDIRVVRNPGTADEEVVCETDDDSRIPEVRVNLLIVGPDIFDGEGFLLVGEARRHGDLPNDRTSVARTVCGTVAPHSTRVTEPPILTTVGTTPISPGRDAFHPCPPEAN